MTQESTRCGHTDEPSVYVEGGEFPTPAEALLRSQNELLILYVYTSTDAAVSMLYALTSCYVLQTCARLFVELRFFFFMAKQGSSGVVLLFRCFCVV